MADDGPGIESPRVDGRGLVLRQQPSSGRASPATSPAGETFGTTEGAERHPRFAGTSPCAIRRQRRTLHGVRSNSQFHFSTLGESVTTDRMRCTAVSYTHLRAHETVLD